MRVGMESNANGYAQSSSRSRTPTSQRSTPSTSECPPAENETGSHSSRQGPYVPPGQVRRREARQRYKGFSFVFATDAYHNEDVLYGRDTADSVTYLKPLTRGDRLDSLPPIVLPYFFAGFQWTDVNGQRQETSRVEVCCAWQHAFNQLLYYGSFVGEVRAQLAPEELEWCQEQFSQWNDLFVELDEGLGRLTVCERARHLPKFRPALALDELENPCRRTNAKTPPEALSATFLAAAREINTRQDRSSHSPIQKALELEKKLRPWEPCRGHTVVRATTWSLDRLSVTRSSRQRPRSPGGQASGNELSHTSTMSE